MTPPRCSRPVASHCGASTDMPRINLLPWRAESKRKERKREVHRCDRRCGGAAAVRRTACVRAT